MSAQFTNISSLEDPNCFIYNNNGVFPYTYTAAMNVGCIVLNFNIIRERVDVLINKLRSILVRAKEIINNIHQYTLFILNVH
jgi:hypothetical protein